jgi:hypothetical protein
MRLCLRNGPNHRVSHTEPRAQPREQLRHRILRHAGPWRRRLALAARGKPNTRPRGGSQFLGVRGLGCRRMHAHGAARGYSGGKLPTKRDGGKVTRPRAADDFATIRAGVEELRRERAQVLADRTGHSPIGPRPYHRATTGETERQSGRLLPRSVGRSSVR